MTDKTKTAMKRQAGYKEMAESPRPRTWSATMPAYCYTELCPDPKLREPGGARKGGDESVGQGDTGPVLRDERGD